MLPHGTGLGATHPPRIWSVSPSDSLPGSVTARGHARPMPTWFTLGHGQGPCSAHADLVYPKVVPVTSPVALTDNRSRHPWGPGASPDPVSIRHDARAILSPSALDEHANRPKCPGEGPTGTEYVADNDKVYVASAQGTWCESHIMAPAVCILNPSNGTHNCRPDGGLRWVRSPTAAHRYKHALARSSNLCFRAAMGRRKFVR